MAHAELIAFDRPLASAALRGQAARLCNEVELTALAEAAYRRGGDEARALADQQMVDLRAGIGQLSDGLLRKLSTLEASLVDQLQAALPGLALEIARRLLAGYEPPAEVVSRLCAEALKELFPERENLELVVSPRDAALLSQLCAEWQSLYPGLRVRSDHALAAGDCQVRSRFGLTDARLSTKLATLSASLTPA
ncbi:MAG: FliH/SctL family protein [Verrucomicrobiota bacterium]